MPVDPWGGFQQGTNQLLTILAARKESKERKEENALRNALLNKQVGVAEAEEKRKSDTEKRTVYGKLLSGVKDASSYASARNYAISLYPQDTASIPQEYDPAFVETMKRAYGVQSDRFRSIGAGGLRDVEKELTIPPAKDPSEKTKLQAKTRTFVDAQTQKVITEEFDYNPHSGERTVKGRYEYPVGTMILGYDADGNAILGTTKGPFQASKTPGDIPLSRTMSETLKTEEAAVSNAIRGIRQIQGLVGESASVIGAVGGAQRFIDSISSQLMSLAKLGGSQASVKGKLGPDSQLLNPDLYEFKGFTPEAAKSAQVKSLFTKLAYSIARAEDPGGRLSDKDVQSALTQLAGSTGSPEQMNAVLDMVAQNLEFEFANKYRVMTKQEFKGFDKSIKTGPTLYKKMSDDELLRKLEGK